MPSKSVFRSRRGLNNRVTAYILKIIKSIRYTARYSILITGLRSRTYKSILKYLISIGLSSLNTTSFLFDDKKKDSITSLKRKYYIQINDNNIPIVYRNNYSGIINEITGILNHFNVVNGYL